MRRRDAGLFLHAIYPFPIFHFSPFKKQTLSEPPVAHHFGCCVHPVPAQPCPCPSQAGSAVDTGWDPSHLPDRAAATNTNPLSLMSPGNGLLCARAFLTPAAAESLQIRVVMGDNHSSVDQAQN